MSLGVELFALAMVSPLIIALGCLVWWSLESGALLSGGRTNGD
jgi:hypothetical protein